MTAVTSRICVSAHRRLCAWLTIQPYGWIARSLALREELVGLNCGCGYAPRCRLLWTQEDAGNVGLVLIVNFLVLLVCKRAADGALEATAVAFRAATESLGVPVALEAQAQKPTLTQRLRKLGFRPDSCNFML